MLPAPTNVPNRVMNAMLAPVINHRSEDFRILYKSIIEKTKKFLKQAVILFYLLLQEQVL